MADHERTLRKALIKLAYENPDLRPKLLPVITGSDVGKTILEQMGGIGRLRAMTGAKDFVTYPDGVAFKFPNRQRSKGNYVKVVWNRGPDDYTMEFQNLTSTTAKKVKTYKNIGVEKLIELFQKQTGLFLRL